MKCVWSILIIFLQTLNSNAYEEVISDFQHYQTYLNPAPIGVDMYYAWTFPGGRGSSVRVIDFEIGWNRDHKEFKPPFIQNEIQYTMEHGTQVWGILASKNDGIGTTGMVSNIEIGLWGIKKAKNHPNWRKNVFESLQDLYTKKILKPGDILLIEIQSIGGPNNLNTPIEYWNKAFTIIKSLTEMGVVVIEAAGNGGQNLDAPEFEKAFNLNKRDSGAILVAAGSAPVASSFYKEHFSKHISSNYGSRIDTFNYGERVATTGYGSLHLSDDENTDYHDDFSATSAASAITAGLVASLMGIAKAQGRILKPLEIRQALRETGQAPHKSVKSLMGTYPNMKELIKYLKLENASISQKKDSTL